MGHIGQPHPVKLFCGLLGAGEAVVSAIDRLQETFGALDGESDFIPFTYTEYYVQEMGPSLLRKFVSFAALADPGRLAAVKRLTNGIEEDLAVVQDGAAKRRVNIDPGYIVPSRLVLATTKDHAHRIYLGEGIYAEVTLQFTKEGCRFFPWTYPDYRTEAYAAFFLECRRRLLEQLRG